MSKNVQSAHDNRKARTQKALEHALARLLEQEDFNQVTTQQIAQEAGVSRGSFYNHFHDKYDLVDQYQRRVFSYMDILFVQQDALEDIIFQALSFLREEPLAQALLSPTGTLELRAYLVEKFKQVLAHELPHFLTGVDLSPTELEYALNYYSYAYLGFVQTWISHHQAESPQDLTALLLSLRSVATRPITGGPDEY